MEVIKEAEQALFHLLNIRDIGEKWVLDVAWLVILTWLTLGPWFVSCSPKIKIHICKNLKTENRICYFNNITDDADLRYFALWLECVPIPPTPNDLDVVFRAGTVGGSWLDDGFGLLRFLLFSSIVSFKLSMKYINSSNLQAKIHTQATLLCTPDGSTLVTLR